MTTKSLLLVAALVLTSTCAQASKSARSLEGAEFLFRSIAETFPEFVRQAINAQEISLQSLDCYSSNEIIKGAHVLKTRCHAIDSNFKSIEDDADLLFLTMINLRLKVHNYSSPGITYVNVRDLKCIKTAKETVCTAKEAWN